MPRDVVNPNYEDLEKSHRDYYDSKDLKLYNPWSWIDELPHKYQCGQLKNMYYYICSQTASDFESEKMRKLTSTNVFIHQLSGTGPTKLFILNKGPYLGTSKEDSIINASIFRLSGSGITSLKLTDYAIGVCDLPVNSNSVTEDYKTVLHTTHRLIDGSHYSYNHLLQYYEQVDIWYNGFVCCESYPPSIQSANVKEQIDNGGRLDTYFASYDALFTILGNPDRYISFSAINIIPFIKFLIEDVEPENHISRLDTFVTRIDGCLSDVYKPDVMSFNTKVYLDELQTKLGEITTHKLDREVVSQIKPALFSELKLFVTRIHGLFGMALSRKNGEYVETISKLYYHIDVLFKYLYRLILFPYKNRFILRGPVFIPERSSPRRKSLLSPHIGGSVIVDKNVTNMQMRQLPSELFKNDNLIKPSPNYVPTELVKGKQISKDVYTELTREELTKRVQRMLGLFGMSLEKMVANAVKMPNEDISVDFKYGFNTFVNEYGNFVTIPINSPEELKELEEKYAAYKLKKSGGKHNRKRSWLSGMGVLGERELNKGTKTRKNKKRKKQTVKPHLKRKMNKHTNRKVKQKQNKKTK